MDIRLAHVTGAQGDNNLKGQRGVARLPLSSAPALLIAYPYLPGWETNRSRYIYRDWALDSGAYSAHNSGTEIDLSKYIGDCLRLMEADPKLAEIFGLDVIGDPEASLRNCERMIKAGIPAVPTFHLGCPLHYVETEAARYPKIALGGMVGKPSKQVIRFTAQVFSRIWPKRIHGFGLVREKLLLRYPFHSVDASSWETGPCSFGNWKSFGKMSVRGSNQNLRAEIEWHLKLERKLKQIWSRQLNQIGISPDLQSALKELRSLRASNGKGGS